MNRFQATLIHLVISICIGLLVLALMLGLWYPNGYFGLMGGATLFYLILGVDVTLGPLLTLIVFKQGKKTLKFDLTTIVLMQLVALIYGANVLFNARPVFSVFEGDFFRVTKAFELDDKALSQAKNPLWRTKSLTGPVLVAAIAPTDSVAKQDMMLEALAGLDWNVFPKYYVDYNSQRNIALTNSKPLATLINEAPENKEKIDKFLNKHDATIEQFVYLPIISGFTVMTAVLDSKTADFFEVLEIEPMH